MLGDHIAKTAFDERAHRRALAGRDGAGFVEYGVGNLYGCLHMGNHIEGYGYIATQSNTCKDAKIRPRDHSCAVTRPGSARARGIPRTSRARASIRPPRGSICDTP